MNKLSHIILLVTLLLLGILISLCFSRPFDITGAISIAIIAIGVTKLLNTKTSKTLIAIGSICFAISLSAYTTDSYKNGEFDALMGLYALHTNQYDKVFFHYQKALDRARKSNDVYHEALYLWSFGRAYQLLDEPVMAIKYFRKAKKVWSAAGYLNKELDALTRIAEIYEEQGNLANALDLRKQALALCIKSKQDVKIAWAYYEIGNLYLDSGKYEETIVAFQHASDYFSKTDIHLMEAELLYLLGNFYKHSDVKKARDQHSRSRHIANKNGFHNLLKRLDEAGLSTVYD